MRDRILTEVFNDSFYRGYCSKYHSRLVDEMISELIDLLSKMNQDRLEELYNNKELRYYCIAIIRNMVGNKNSQFNKDYINNNFEIIDDILHDPIEGELTVDVSKQEDELISDIFDYLKERSKTVCGAWYDEEMFKLYFKSDDSFRALSDKTSIPTASIFSSVKKTQELINNEFKKRYDDII